MKHWDLRSISVEPHKPEVLHSEGEGRSIAIHLPVGEELSDHQVHERAWLVIVDGAVQVQAGSETVDGPAGSLFVFEPNERHEVRASADSRLLLLLGPWPGDGHPSQPA